jgi:hypothetical protein
MKINALLPDRYLILCLRDVSATTSVEMLKKFTDPLFEHALPINVAIVPNIHTPAYGSGEIYDPTCDGGKDKSGFLPIGRNHALVDYLIRHHAYECVQLGCHHNYGEFLSSDQASIVHFLEEGRNLLMEAGLGCPRVFLAPQDQLSKVALIEVAKRFELISLTHYEAGGIPNAWLAQYAWKVILQQYHWRVGNTLLLSHALVDLASSRPVCDILDQCKRIITTRRLSIINFYCWDLLQGKPQENRLKELLYRLADYIVSNGFIKIILFSTLVDNPHLFSDVCRA